MKLHQFFCILAVFGARCLLNGSISIPQSIQSAVTQELSQVKLSVKGTIPDWLQGSLVRNGPISVTIDGQKLKHWFDGPAMLHSFSFHENKIVYSNRFLNTQAYQKIFQEGSFDYTLGFASGYIPPLHSRIWSFLFPPSSHSMVNNANVNVWQYHHQPVALTEVPPPVKFDLKTLETLGNFEYLDHLPKDQSLESAHPHFDHQQKESINYMVDYGMTSHYLITRIKENSSTRELITKIPVDKPAYMHSFAVTEHYVILTEFPLVVRPLDFIIHSKPFIANFNWEPERGTPFTVIDRASGNIVATFKAPPFFAFHHVNAYEEGSQIILDLVTYPDPLIIDGLAAEEIENPEPYRQTLMRFQLFLNTQTLTTKTIAQQFLEFPRINDRYDGYSYQFAYAVDPRTHIIDGEKRPLYKINLQDYSIMTWSEPDCFCGEPVFVPAPDATQEDEGVILSVVTNPQSKSSFLVILDGKKFQEIARAEIPQLVPEGFHGQFFSN